MSCIRIYKREEPEYKRLEAAKSLINAFIPEVRVEISDIYYDLGANWMYTALVVNRKDGASYQLSNMKAYEIVLYGSYYQFVEAVESMCKVIKNT